MRMFDVPIMESILLFLYINKWTYFQGCDCGFKTLELDKGGTLRKNVYVNCSTSSSSSSSILDYNDFWKDTILASLCFSIYLFARCASFSRITNKCFRALILRQLKNKHKIYNVYPILKTVFKRLLIFAHSYHNTRDSFWTRISYRTFKSLWITDTVKNTQKILHVSHSPLYALNLLLKGTVMERRQISLWG